MDYLGLQWILRGFYQIFPPEQVNVFRHPDLGYVLVTATLGISPPGPHCDGGGTSRRNLQRQGMGSLHNDAVMQHGRPAQVYGAQERVGAISTWSKLSGQAQSWGFRTHTAMFTRSEMAGWRFLRVIAHHRRCQGPVPKGACPAAPADRAQPPRAALLRCGEP